jgi:hypothetical protein
VPGRASSHRRTRRSRQRRHKPSTASCCRPCREKRMRTSLSSIFRTKGYAGRLGLLLDCVAGPRWWTAGGLLRTEEVQVRFSPLLFFFHFCFYFLFSFSNLHSILNSNLNLYFNSFLFCRC